MTEQLPPDELMQTIDRVCRGVASTQEGQQVREYIDRLRQAAEGVYNEQLEKVLNDPSWLTAPWRRLQKALNL